MFVVSVKHAPALVLKVENKRSVSHRVVSSVSAGASPGAVYRSVYRVCSRSLFYQFIWTVKRCYSSQLDGFRSQHIDNIQRKAKAADCQGRELTSLACSKKKKRNARMRSVFITSGITRIEDMRADRY